jgi:hypothetical protein
MTHWLDGVAEIFSANTGNLRELAVLSGIDPRYCYAHQDLSGCDLRGQDLTDMQFPGCNLENAVIDDKTIIDPEFDPRVDLENIDGLIFRISSDINTLVLNYMEERKLKNRDKTYHRLLREGYESIYSKRFDFYNDIIEANNNLYAALQVRSVASIPIQFNFSFDLLGPLFRKYGQENAINRIILVALIRKRVRFSSKKDYSNVSPNAFFPPKLMRVRRT